MEILTRTQVPTTDPHIPWIPNPKGLQRRTPSVQETLVCVQKTQKFPFMVSHFTHTGKFITIKGNFCVLPTHRAVSAHTQVTLFSGS